MGSAIERVLENPEYVKSFYVDNEKLFCDVCQNTVLDHTKKYTIDKHLKSKKHISNAEKKRIDNEREQMNVALVKSFIQADIPLEKVDKLKSFFQEYCVNGDAIANSSLLQEKYLPVALNAENFRIQEWLCNKRLSIIIDETTDYYGQAVFNVFFNCGGQTSLARTEYLNIVNNISIAQLVMRTLHSYNVSFDKLAFFISDNAEYMLQAFQVLSPLMPRLKHNRCLARIIDLVGESWIYYKNFKFLTNIVSNIEISFIQCPARKKRWCDLLSFLNFYATDSDYNQFYGNWVILPYLPIKCDLISLFKFIIWISHHLSQLRTFYIGEEMINNESEIIQELAMIFKNQTQFFIFEVFIMFIASNTKCIVDDYEYFRIKNKPIAPFVARRLARLEATLQYGCTHSPFNDELKIKFSASNIDPKLYIMIFQEAFQIALIKLKKHIDNHPTLPVFNAIQCFDPCYIRTHCNSIDSYSEIEEFRKPEKNIVKEWEIYCNLEEEFGNEELDLDNYWKNKAETLPYLSKLALDYIWLPVSGL
ncbi:hypothetical protein RclHR1_04730013 [Rhizophagus clarus]|uniref:CGG triplet repeat-binding protein 1 n=1 Tax=Rhizophagus clarus TaxID=94130 RepID=A0A2Z6S1Q1_9GLOM|nr:hypothetical protein RclHR1_04730013 [Rhizophagus clarus]GES92871.1 CGG triplet repeat-binding protein 1 [Rhizophagus clarus]